MYIIIASDVNIVMRAMEDLTLIVKNKSIIELKDYLLYSYV